MNLSDFADAVTGQGYMDCELDFPEPVDFCILGKNMETKRVNLPYKEEPKDYYGDVFKVWYLELVKLHEVDGWVADAEKEFNSHQQNFVKKTYQVIFRRWL